MRSSNNPRVMLLMLTYNHFDCVGAAIMSILSQTYTNFELHIVDDLSEDDTFRVLKFFEENDARICLSQNQVNLGMFENFRVNVQRFNDEQDFEYLAWLGPDDNWDESWLEKLVLQECADSPYSTRQSSVEYDFGEKKLIRRYSNILSENLSYQESKKLRNGYGQLIHGIWHRKTVQSILIDSETLPFEYLFRLENLFVALLIEKWGFSTLDEPLHTKQKVIGSYHRYKDNHFFQHPDRIFKIIIRSLPQVVRIILKKRRSWKFLLGAWLIDLRVSLPIQVKK